MKAAEATFWIAFLVVTYIYFGYPLLLAVLSSPRKHPGQAQVHNLPTVTLIISAYNERSVIVDKIQNSLALDYPPELLSVLVVSDCSDDGTDEIVRGFRPEGVRLLRSHERQGKTAGLNLGVSQSSSEILIFSDANAMYQRDAIRQLVRHFSDPAVGYVVGNAKYVEKKSQSASASSEGLYWKLETWIKQRESDFGSVVGGDGAIYAIRRTLYSVLRSTDINDFLNPLQIITKGYRGVYEPAAICFEEAGDTFDKEFRRKVRIVSRSLNAVLREPRVLLPWVQPAHWLALVSHKLLRWFAWLFLVAAFVTGLLLWIRPVYFALVLLQLAFYLLALCGWVLQRRGPGPRVVYIPYYFCLVNLASLMGIIKCFSGALSPTWQTVRQSVAVEDPIRPVKGGS